MEEGDRNIERKREKKDTETHRKKEVVESNRNIGEGRKHINTQKGGVRKYRETETQRKVV